ncbi:uncharacterized protein LOC129953992 isoform X2 [Eupeodes corollae]|nr:uncharacterized protein LOC129953992 isoform X2 [Eupeodes corollae]
MANSITFEQFLHHTNAEEIIVRKMKEAGPRIYQINYKRRLKHCKVLYKKFYDVKLRDSVLDYGLVLKPMPNSFKSKFLQFPLKNNSEGDNINSDTTENNSENKIPIKSPTLEDKYKNDLPSTSSAFFNKPRLVLPCEKNKTQEKTKLKLETNTQKNCSKKEHNSLKLAPKRRISLDKKPKSSNKSPKITNYFPSDTDEDLNGKQNLILRKSIPKTPNENIEIDQPKTKILKMSPIKKIGTQDVPQFINSSIGSKSSKDETNQNKTKRDYRSFGHENSLKKKSKTNNRLRLYSDDFVSDDCDINTNNSIVNLTIEDSKEQPYSSKLIENNSSPSKSALPKRIRTEDYGKVLNNLSKELLKEISPERPKNGFSNNEIELWIKDGQKALEEKEDNNISCLKGDRTLMEDVFLERKLQTIKTKPDKVKKYIKYWLNFKTQMKKRLNMEATIVSETSKARILFEFGQMTYEDFKNVINIQKHISRWTSLGRSMTELEENLKNQYMAFIKKEKSWPKVHIELARLQSHLHSKGIKGTIPLKSIPPRIISFDEVLEKTNIKESISLNSDRPPESYKELLNLCKKEYEKCCCKGIWTEGLKFVDKNEEAGSSQEMSIELFTEPSMSMSNDLLCLQILDGSGCNNNVTRQISSNKQCELEQLSKGSTKVHRAKPKKPSRCGPKSRRKQSSKSDEDDLEMQVSHVFGGDEKHSPKLTSQLLKPMNTQELNQILTHIPTQLSNDYKKDVSHSEGTIRGDIANCVDSVAKQPIITHKQASNVKFQSLEVNKVLTPSPNILESSDETNIKCSSVKMISETNEALNTIPSKNLESSVSNNNKIENMDNLIPLSPNIFHSSEKNQSQCLDSNSTQVQIHESVYVPCESNNDFHTEQYNYSININEATQSKDPFGETVASEDETDIIILDVSFSSEKSEIIMKNSTNSREAKVPEQAHNDELDTSEKSISLVNDFDSDELVGKTTQNIVDSEETIVLKNLLLSCQTDSNHSKDTLPTEKLLLSGEIVLAGNLETSDSQVAHNNELNVSKQSLLGAESLGSNKVSEKTTTNTSNIETAILPILPNNNRTKKSAPLSMPASHSDTVHSLKKTVFDEKIQISVSKAQSIDPLIDVCDVAPNLSETNQGENVQSMQSDRNTSSQSVYFHQSVANQEDFNQNGNKTNNSKSKVENIESDLNSTVSGDPRRNVKIVVKRESFSEQFSEYCDDVEIVEMPKSEAMVIDDEETAPELLEALLCNSSNNESFPMTTVHTTISHATSSIYLESFAQAQQFPSNFDLTQSQSDLNQLSNQSTNVPSRKVSKKYPGITIQSSDCNSSNCQVIQTPHDKTTYLIGSVLADTAQSMNCKKQYDHKQSHFINKSVSNMCKDDMLLSETSFVSIAPQNIPSDIEFSQISCNKFPNQKQKEHSQVLEESSKHAEKANKHSFVGNTPANSALLVGHTRESGSETNKRCANLEQQELNDQNNIPDKCLKRNMPQGLSPSKINVEEKSKPQHDYTGINEQDGEQPDGTLAEDSLSKSSDVELLEESTDEEVELPLVAEMTTEDVTNNQNNKMNQTGDPSNNTAREQVEASQSSELIRLNECEALSLDILKKPNLSSNTTANTTVVNNNNSVNIESVLENINLEISLENSSESPDIQCNQNQLNVNVRSIEKTDFVTKRKISKHIESINKVLSDKETTLNDISPRSSVIQTNIQSNSHDIEKNINLSSNPRIDLDEGNTQISTNINISDENVTTYVPDSKSLETNTCSVTQRSKKLQEAVEQVLKIKKNVNTNKRCRTLSEQLQPVNIFTMTSSFSQPSEVYHSDFSKQTSNVGEVCLNSLKSKSQRLSEKQTNETKENNTNKAEPTIISKSKTITLKGFIPFGAIQNIQATNEDYVEVPKMMVEKQFLSIVSSVCKNTDLTTNNSLQDRFSLKINVDLTIPEHIESSVAMLQEELTKSTKPLMAAEELIVQDSSLHDKHSNKLLKEKGDKTKLKIPSILKKNTAHKKYSKPSDFVQQKTHAFSSIPLKPCNKAIISKPHSLLSIEECDYLIEDASQQTATATVSQILGTDCTYFENSELLRNLDNACITHHLDLLEQQIEQPSPQVPTPTLTQTPPPATSKVINLAPITLSEGVTARKVWQVNLQWKSQYEMAIEVRFSVNKRSMTACDESAKQIFNFPQEIWSDIHRILREIDRFEYKRRTLKNKKKSTSLHKILGQLFSSSTQVVDVKIINDCYNPFTICEKTIPVYRKPFQCLMKGINQNILTKMNFLKEDLREKKTMS